MLRSTLIAAGAAVLCSASFAQQTIDPSEVYPITAPVKDAGVYNVNTQRWMSPSRVSAQQGAIQVIYNNTCTWIPAAYYTGTGSCETYIDEGEIPNASNLDWAALGGVGATSTNNVALVQFAYCTNFALPTLTIGFYDTLGGQCGGLAPQTGNGQPSLAAQACPAGFAPGGLNPSGKAYYVLDGTIPGDSTPGGTGVSCWIVGTFLGNSGFCIKSEGDGIWDNAIDSDRFNWSWEMNDPIVSGTAASGVILNGEPAAPGTVAFGGCSYNLPCNTDVTGAPCGTGFGQDDGFWINVDGDRPDGTTNSGITCISAPTAGTGCYWFGGYPANPYGGFWMVMVADGACDGVVPTVSNCQTGATVLQGCQSVASTVGLPSASAPGGFFVSFGSLNSGVNGVVYYGISGPTTGPWSAQSIQCVKSPVQRLNGIPGASGSTGGAGFCQGNYTVNFNAIIQGAFPGLLGVPMAAGQGVNVQAWFRDPPATKTTQLSDSVGFTVGA